VSNIRRSRGYAYEHGLVERFNALDGWHARRLGGSSTGLPDIVALNNKEGILLTIEAKSGTSDILYVPKDQIERCKMVRNMFSIYPTRHVIFAFKFMSKKRFRRKNTTVYEQRKLIEYYKIADILLDDVRSLPIVKCTYDGRTFAIYDDTRTEELNLPDLALPFCNNSKLITNGASKGHKGKGNTKTKILSSKSA
jgi:Holliday junction resolvase